MKNKTCLLTGLNFVMFIISLSMFIYVLYSIDVMRVQNRRNFKNVELNQLKFVEKSEVIEAINLVNENLNQLYSMSYYVATYTPQRDYEDNVDYIAYTTDQLDSIFVSCKNKATRRYRKKYDKTYSYYRR